MDDLDLGDLNLDDLDLDEGASAAGGGKTGGPRRPKRFVIFLVGLALGIGGTLLAPRYLGRYLPDSLRGDLETIEGTVDGKRLEGSGGERLLLTVNAAQGAVLATFTERVAEIDLLVSEGDSVTLGVQEYRPFIENPEVRGVRKASGERRREGADAGEDEAASEMPTESEAPGAGESGEEAATEEGGAVARAADEPDAAPEDSTSAGGFAPSW